MRIPVQCSLGIFHLSMKLECKFILNLYVLGHVHFIIVIKKVYRVQRLKYTESRKKVISKNIILKGTIPRFGLFPSVVLPEEMNKEIRYINLLYLVNACFSHPFCTWKVCLASLKALPPPPQ